jgi:hypothetical protein
MPTPYQGDPTSYPSEVDVLATTDAPTPSNFNVPHMGILDRAAWLYAHDTRAAEDWYPEIAPSAAFASSSAGIVAAAWDPNLRQWLVVALNNVPTSCEVFSGYGMDQSAQWSIVGSLIAPIGQPIIACAIAADPTTAGNYWLGTSSSNGSTYGLNVYQYASGSWTQEYNDSGFHTDVQMATLGSRIIFLECQNTSTGMSLNSSANSGSTWQTTPLLQGATSYLLKSSGTQAIAIPYGLPLTTFAYYVSSDGVTWTTQNLPALNGGVQYVTGLTWGADLQGPCWLITVQVTSTTTSTYRSPDGLSWTLQAAGASNLKQIGDIAYAAGATVATLGDQSSAGPSGMIWTPDGGLTWKAGQAWFSSNAAPSTTGYQRSRIVASDQGFLGVQHDLDEAFASWRLAGEPDVDE